MQLEALEKLNGLADQVGEFIQYWGFKKVHGRVWTHLYLSPKPLDAADLMERLGISKSLASITLNDLLRHNVILSRGKGPKETQVYVANDEVRDVILNILKSREKLLLDRVEAEQHSLLDQVSRGSCAELDSHRLESLGRMISEAQLALSAILLLKEVDYSQIQMK